SQRVNARLQHAGREHQNAEPTTHADSAHPGRSRGLSYVGLLTACAELLQVHRDDDVAQFQDLHRQLTTRSMEDGTQRAGTLLVLALVSLGSADRAIAQ